MNAFFKQTNPVVKGLGCLALVITFSFHRFGAAYSLACLALIMSVLAVSRESFESVFGKVKSLGFLLVAVVVLQVFNQGGQGLSAAYDGIMRICGVLLASVMYVSLASPEEIMYFGERCFAPLRWIGMSPKGWALALVIALRFLPQVFVEIDRVKMAQSARGADFSQASTSWWNQVSRFIPLLVPVLLMSIRRGETLSLAMAARGFRIHGTSTRFKGYPFRKMDALAGLVLLFFAGFSLISW